MTDERQDSTNYEGPHVKEHNHFNPVITDVSGTLGVIILGVIALILLMALLRAQARNRQLSENE
jgi:hypothetical protein